MALTEVQFTRHNKTYKAFLGIDDETKNAPIAIVPSFPHPVSGQVWELVLSDLHIKCDTARRGTPIQIHTVWEERHYDNNGNLINSHSHPRVHSTAAWELPLFFSKFMPLLQPSVYNGAIRGGKNAFEPFLGQNAYPLFDSVTGARIPDSADNTDKAPSYTYNTPPPPADVTPK
jgi:hypothetical protein